MQGVGGQKLQLCHMRNSLEICRRRVDGGPVGDFFTGMQCACPTATEEETSTLKHGSALKHEQRFINESEKEIKKEKIC